MLEQKDISNKMTKDIDEMENMLNNYLQFAKSQVQEESTAINVNNFFEEIKKNRNIDNLHLDLSLSEEVVLVARRSALMRCFNNIIENGLSYGKNIYIQVSKSTNRLIVTIDDDGPGIPVNQYKNVFKPFYRLDKGRNLNHSGVGLGLSITEDIVRSHGGSIQLGDSVHKGLQVKISLPF
jgi:two-component system osmolarity sensor histidine kinase EnvZ